MRSWIVPTVVPTDFRPFYCAGKVILLHEDPYRVEPLRSCEADLGRPSTTREDELRYFVEPAPLPGYDFLPLAALALVPFYAAKLLFAVLSLGAVVVAGICLARLSRLPVLLTLAVAYFAIGYESTDLGQLSPIAIALLFVAALAIRNGRDVVALCAVGGAMIQPQIAAFPLVALAVFVPRTRVPAALLVIVLGIGSFAALGLPRSLEYIQILPLHSSTQLLNGGQYSVAALLATLGVRPSIALALGSAWAVAALAIVLVVLRRAKVNLSTSGAIIAVPTVFASLGGTFIHATQIGVALLAAVTLSRPTARRWFWSSLALGVLVVPFAELPYTRLGVETVLVYGLALACAYAIVLYCSGPFRAWQRAATVTGLLGLAVVVLAATRPPLHAVTGADGKADQPAMFASAANLRHNTLYNHANVTLRYRVASLLLRLPTWIALLVIGGASSTFVLGAARSLPAPPSGFAAGSGHEGSHATTPDPLENAPVS